MKAIINGKRYDTDKATFIGDAEQGHQGDFSYWHAGLYRTRHGAYFLAGNGGPMTKWAQPCGNNGHTGGSKVILLSPRDALEWAERHLTTEQVEAAFAGLIEDA